MGDVLRAAMVAIAIEAAGMLGALSIGFDAFGLVHLVYLAAVAGMPVSAITVLSCRGLAGRGWGRRGGSAPPGPVRLSKTAWAVLVVCLVPLPVGVYGSFIEPHRLQLRSATLRLDGARAGHTPIRIGVLSDLQATSIGEYERRAVATLQAQEPDLILLPGDLMQVDDASFDRELPAARELVASLHAPGGVWVVGGDVDVRPRALAGSLRARVPGG